VDRPFELHFDFVSKLPMGPCIVASTLLRKNSRKPRVRIAKTNAALFCIDHKTSSGALAPRSNPESVLWTLDCFGAKGRLGRNWETQRFLKPLYFHGFIPRRVDRPAVSAELAMTGQGVILNEALY
jgi:hypothetical protein